MGSLKIRHKILILALFICLIVLIPSIIISLFSSQSQIREMADTELKKSASIAKVLLEKSTDDIETGSFSPGSASLRELNQVLDNLQRSTKNHFSLLNYKGKLLTTTLRKSRIEEVESLIKGKAEGDLFKFSMKEEPSQLGYLTKVTIKGSRYSFIISRSSAELASYLRTNIMFFAGLTLLCIIASFALSGITAHKFSVPLEQLASGVSRISRGDLDHKVKVDTKDEIQFVADNINTMADNLKKKINALITSNHSLDHKNRSLDCLNQINQAIINFPDLTELLNRILEIVVTAVNCEHGSMMTLDNEKLKVKVIFWEDLDVEVVERICLAPGQGVAGKALELKEGIMENRIGQSDIYARYEKLEWNEKINNLLCLPLIVDDEPVGVINLVNKMVGFSKADLELGMSLAAEVAIAFKNRQLYEMSITDGLTGIYIHRYFQARLDEEMFRSERYDTALSLIMMDIDHFKKFNDTYGHQIGDLVLKSVASRAKMEIRHKIDILARYGGEEFAIICPDTPYQGAIKLAERIRRAIDKMIVKSGGQTFHVTCSFGVSDLKKGMDKARLIKLADQALYTSKEKGRNCVS